MVDQISDIRACRLCGALLAQGTALSGDTCETCAANQKSQNHPAWQVRQDSEAVSAAPYGAYYQAATQPEPGLPDPDRPWWGLGWGISAWLFSFIATLVISLVAIFVWYFVERRRGMPVPNLADQEAFKAWVLSPNVIFVSILSTVGAHLLTLAFCWLVVTRFRKQSFWSSLGWNWAGKSFGYWMLASLAIVFAVLAVSQIFVKVLPQGKTPFDQMLDTSNSVRIAVAAMAVLTAPFAEELVYRGVLFAGLRKRLALWPTIGIITLLFAGVHVMQYWGAWASMAALTTLSLILTMVRGYTKSILPGVLIHTVFNALGALEILKPDDQKFVFSVYLGVVALSLLLWYFLKPRRAVPA